MYVCSSFPPQAQTYCTLCWTKSRLGVHTQYQLWLYTLFCWWCFVCFLVQHISQIRIFIYFFTFQLYSYSSCDWLGPRPKIGGMQVHFPKKKKNVPGSKVTSVKRKKIRREKDSTENSKMKLHAFPLGYFSTFAFRKSNTSARDCCVHMHTVLLKNSALQVTETDYKRPLEDLSVPAVLSLLVQMSLAHTL